MLDPAADGQGGEDDGQASPAGIPPNRATSGLAVTFDPGLVARARPVGCEDLGPVAGHHLLHGELVLGRERFSIDVWASQHSALSRQTLVASR